MNMTFLICSEQELNITPKPTKNKNRKALKPTQIKEATRAKEAIKALIDER